MITGKACTESQNGFLGAAPKEKKLWLFVSNIEGDVVEDMIKQYISEKTKDSIEEIYMKKIETRKENLNYQTVMIGVKINHKEMMYQEEFWPTGVRVSRFNFNLRK